MCVGLPGRRSIGPGLIFLVLFASRQKEHKSYSNKFMFFLLLVQKKEPKKSTPAMIYSHCRRPDLASVLLLTQLNNSYHSHIPILRTKRLASCLIANPKGA